MIKEYTFTKIYDMDYTLDIISIKAKDLHQAMMLFLQTHSIKDYDLIKVDGEYTF